MKTSTVKYTLKLFRGDKESANMILDEIRQRSNRMLVIAKK